MSLHGIGDRWLAGESIDGITFGPGDTVVVTGGAHDGAIGRVALLLGVAPEPSYLVASGTGGNGVRVRQSALRPVS